MPPRGNVALYSTLLIAGIALTAALTLSARGLSTWRLTDDAVRSERAYQAADSGLIDALQQLKRDPSIAALPSLTVDEATVVRAIASTASTRTVTATATLASTVITVRADCDLVARSCAFSRP